MIIQRTLFFLALMSLTTVLSLTSPALSWAQTEQEAQAATKEAAQEARDIAEKRIEAQMIEMSDLTEALIRNLGQLHYLRALCFGEDDQYWRDFAGRMLTLESANDEKRRQYLTRAFNAGYFIEQQRFKTCSSNVAVDAAALAENGRRLASMLGDPYRDF